MPWIGFSSFSFSSLTRYFGFELSFYQCNNFISFDHYNALMWWVKYFANEKSSLYVIRVKYVNRFKKTILETKLIMISNYIAGSIWKQLHGSNVKFSIFVGKNRTFKRLNCISWIVFFFYERCGDTFDLQINYISSLKFIKKTNS